jgi:hypothetical protein
VQCGIVKEKKQKSDILEKGGENLIKKNIKVARKKGFTKKR